MAHTKEPPAKTRHTAQHDYAADAKDAGYGDTDYAADVKDTGDTVAVLDAPAAPAALAVPTGPGDLAFDVNAVQGTRHAGPILCGDPADGVAGIVMLAKRYVVTVANSNFSIPIQFPIGSLVTQMIAAVSTAYNGTTPLLNLGVVQNGTSAASLALGAAAQVFANVPVALPASGILWLSQVLGASTAGACTVLILYNVPAKTLPT
jgi:hypothetical protein